MINKELLSKSIENTNLTKVKYINTDESFFNTALTFLKSINEEVNDANKKLYISVLESDNHEVINKSFSDFGNFIKAVIDKFLEFIKEIFNRFIIQLNKIVKSDAYLNKHISEFSKFSSSSEFYMDLYNFTIYPDVPSAHAYDNYMEDILLMESIFNDFKSHGVKDDSSYKLKALGKINESIADESWYDDFRGECLETVSIPKSDYSNEIFKVFRDGQSSKSQVYITKSVIGDICKSFAAYKNDIDTTKDNKEKIYREYMNIRKSIGNNLDDDGNITNLDVQLTTEKEKKLALIFFKAKQNQIEKMCEIHTLAFSGKLDAIKERYTQDKSVLYKALLSMSKNGKDEE